MSRPSLQLAALLSIVPYFHNRGAVRVADAARDLGMTEKKLRTTLWELWSCGLPGYGPGDLIDLGFSTEDLDEAELVEVTYTAGIDRPVRLTAGEAVALETALAVFLDQPGAVDQQALRDLMATLRSASGATAPAVPAGGDPGVDAPPGPEGEIVRRSVRDGRALRFVYHSASSDTSAVRVVDPARVYVADGHTYLVGVDRAVGEWRTFRADRMRGVEDVGERRPVGPEPCDHASGGERVERAVLRPGAEWFLDEFPFRDVVCGPDGRVEVGITYHDDAWLRRFLLGHADVLTPLADRLRSEVAGRARDALDPSRTR